MSSQRKSGRPGRRDVARVIPADQRDRYPNLAEDLAVLAVEVEPVFGEHDRRAVALLRRYRRLQLVMIFGSVVVTALGGTQALLAGERWPGILLAVLGVLLTACSQLMKETAPQAAALESRIKAERLRAVCFRYLSGRGRYGGPDRETELRRAVLAIEAGRELS